MEENSSNLRKGSTAYHRSRECYSGIQGLRAEIVHNKSFLRGGRHRPPYFMLNYDKIYRSMYKAAHKLAKKTNYKYEPDELVNACWIMGAIQRLDNIKFAYKRAMFDMIDYIRLQEKLRSKAQPDILEFLPNTYIVENKEPELDKRDQVDNIISVLEPMERLIIKLYLDDFNFQEIGKITGYHPSRISQVFPGIIDQLRERVRSLHEKP